MRVLLDTNVIIHREANRVIHNDIGILFRWIDKLHYTKCIHPLTAKEIARNPNKDTVNTMHVKLENYYVLKTEAPFHPAVKAVSNSIDVKDNDKEDTILLNEVYSDRVDVLLTEDKKIHLKACMLGIPDRVFRIDAFLEKLVAENPNLIDYTVLSIRKEYFGNIPLYDPFFNSFREDYPGFDKWFNKKAEELAYLCYNNGELSAFLYIKDEHINEDYTNINPPFTKKHRLKIGTFKVTSNGLKLGERFLKIVFDNARLYKVDEVYVTIFDKRPEQLRLISLLEEYGFTYYGYKTSPAGQERVYIRNMQGVPDPLNPKFTFPKLIKDAKAYIIPIKAEYHTELFPDSILRSESPLNFSESEPHRNAISKVYVSHSLNRELKRGDTIVFYRTGGLYKGVATTIGIVEDIITSISSVEELTEICRKRTVLSQEELHEYWDRNPKNRPFVINFLYAYSFKRRLNLKAMLDHKILPDMDAVKTITQISIEALSKLISLSGI